MTENWQAEPAPWLAPGHEQPEAGPQTGDPAAQGIAPMRLHVNGDVVSLGPPMAEPPKLTPAAGPGIPVAPVSPASPVGPVNPAGVGVPQIAAPLDEGHLAPSQFAASQFAPQPPMPVPPPFLEGSYGSASPYTQSPYSEEPYVVEPAPYAEKPLDNQPYIETLAPPPVYQATPVYTPEPDYKPEPVYTPEPIVPQPIPAPPPLEPQLYIEPTSVDSPTATIPAVQGEGPYPQLTPVPHPSYQQRPVPPAAVPTPVATPVPAPAPTPTNPPIAGGPDPHATMMVAVGTVQPRAPQPPATVEDAERVLGAAVDSLDADPDMYSIGTVTDGAVCLVPDDGRWAVFLADAGQRRFAGSFDDPMMAAVHFAGVLLLAAAERGAIPKPSAPAPAALLGQAPGQAGGDAAGHNPGPDPGQNAGTDPGQSPDQNYGQSYGQNSDQHPGHSTDPLAQFLAGPPITPLAGDPPTTLYTDHRLTVLTPGTEVDRFGDQLGNTVYAARTLYPHRSLPPDYIEREYRVYRVRDPLRVLTGTAIPWFGQPGGGTAYLLSRPIADLLREGALVEIPAATVAPS
ncbi:MAG: glycohydrolase toxin TNT-related protein [Catenulispora sp.]|nr:glycohydrolase toxin TNT-related protein [Catenulispora sp.]